MRHQESGSDRSKAASAASNTLRKTHKLQHRPPFDCVALLLQGGGAVGAYQPGVYEALAEADLYPIGLRAS
jgi:NTE family protein